MARRRVRARRCRGAWTPGSASRACRCRAASGSGWRWPAPCSAARRCWSSTTRCRRWTCTPRRRSRRRCAACWRGVTALVVAHRPSTVLLADRVAMLAAGGSPRSGTHQELLAERPGLPGAAGRRRCGRGAAVTADGRRTAGGASTAEEDEDADESEAACALLRARLAPAARRADPRRTGGRCGGRFAARRRRTSPSWPGRCSSAHGHRHRRAAPRCAGDAAAAACGRSRATRASAARRHGLRAGFLTGHRPDRPGGAADAAAAGCSPTCSGCSLRLPRAVHLGPDHLPADQRRRGPGRAAREGPRRAGARCSRASTSRCCWCGSTRCSAWSCSPGSSRWCSPRAGSSATRGPATGAPGTRSPRLIVQFIETMGGIRAVQAFRREPRNDEIMDGLGADNREANAEAFCAVALVRRGRCAGSATSPVARPRRTARCGWSDGRWRSAPSRRSCSTCAGSTTRSTSWPSSTTPTSRRPRRWRRSPAVLEEPPRCPSPPTRCRCRRRRGASCGSTASGSPTGRPSAPCCRSST